MFDHLLRKCWPFPALQPGIPASGSSEGEYYWCVLPPGRELWGDSGPDLQHWLTSGLAVRIKHGAQRTVWRVELPEAIIFVKQCRINTPRAWLREMFRPAKARLEFENALILRAQGIDAIEPLAWGARSPLAPGDSFLITRWHPGTLPFENYLSTSSLGGSTREATSKRQAIAVSLGRLFGRMHNRGIAHPDPHPGNLLIHWEAGVPRFWLIDLHAIRLGEPLRWPESRDNLVLFNRWFQLRATRTDRARFWNAYWLERQVSPRSLGADAHSLAREVEAETARSNARFWVNRLPRPLKTNRQFVRFRNAHGHGYAVRDFPTELVEQLKTAPETFFEKAGTVILKDSRSSKVAVITPGAEQGPQQAILKIMRVRSRVEPWKNVLRPSAGKRSWQLGHNLLDRGLPTPRPLAYWQTTRHGIPAESYLLTEYAPEALTLNEAVHQAQGQHRLIFSWADTLGRLIRTMHEREVMHRDLKAPNLLMANAQQDLALATPMLIDLVGVQVGRVVPQRQRIQNLARLNASFWQSSAISRTDRLRFLRAYMNWGLRGSDGWKDLWRQIAVVTQRKAAQNARNGRPLH